MQMKEVREMIRLVSQSNLSMFEMENDGFKIRMEKNSDEKLSASMPIETEPLKTVQPVKEVEPAVQKLEGIAVPAPLVGVFYEASNPDSPPFVKVGDRVKKGDVLCILEAMKVMNEIVAPQDGTIISCLVENDQLVEYGQPLFEIA